VKTLTMLFALLALAGCAQQGGEEEIDPMARKLAQFTPVELTADLSGLSENERAMIPLLIEAAEAMDDIFWMQAYGDRDELLATITEPAARRYAEINYGPWDRLDADRPFLDGYGPKPLGARFYPEDMKKEEFEAAVENDPALESLYTLVRRDDEGKLTAVPYHEAFAEKTALAIEKILEAAALAEDPGLKRYLELRAEALRTDEYFESDIAWLDMKDNGIDVVIGPIENYEDQLFNAKAAHEAFVLIKDREWSERLSRYATLLPELQRGLPVPDAYKAETPGSDSDLNAYDVVYFAGDCNAGVKTIAINLPNDEKVQLEKGTRRLQLKNAMRAKFDKILLPISDVLIAEDQREHIEFDSFFGNVMFHEVSHGLGIKHTINGKGTVREALTDQSSALEEAKADVLGLYMITRLHEMGELDVDLMDNYVTFLAGFFRSIRFGATSAHGRANTAQLAFFQEMGAFSRDEATGTYRVDFDKMQEAVTAMAKKILMLQGDGDYDGVVALLPDPDNLDPVLRADLDRLADADIPVDIVFEQGTSVLGL
jgi:hypothetical protein